MSIITKTKQLYLLYHSSIDKYAAQMQRQLVLHGCAASRYNENFDFNSVFYETRLNCLMRSTALICFVNRAFCQFDTLKKELHVVEKTQKSKRTVLILLEKIPHYELFYEKSDIVPRHVFVIDGLAAREDEYDETFQCLMNFLHKTDDDTEQLLNERYFFSQFFAEKSETKLRPLSSIIKNAIQPTKSAFKKQFELIHKKFENLVELYSVIYDFDRNVFSYDFVGAYDVLVKFEQIENEIDLLLDSLELQQSVSLGYGIRVPNPNMVHLMNLYKKFFRFKQFIIRNLLDADFLITNQHEYKEHYRDMNASLKELLAQQVAVAEKQMSLMKRQVELYDDNLLENFGKMVKEMEIELRKEGLADVYEELKELEKNIESKEIMLDEESKIKHFICFCLKNERIKTLQEKLDKSVSGKNMTVLKLNRNEEKLKRYFSVKEVADFIHVTKIEYDELTIVKEVAKGFLKKLENVQYASYTVSISSVRHQMTRRMDGHFLIQLFETNELSTPKIELNQYNVVGNKHPFSFDENDEFEIFTWRMEHVKFVKVFFQSVNDYEELFIKQMMIKTPERGKITFKVDRALSKFSGDSKTELQLYAEKAPEKMKKLTYQIAVYIELENDQYDKKIDFLIQLHGDQGTTTEIEFVNVKGKKADLQMKQQQQTKNTSTIMYEKAFQDYLTGDIHTLVLYSKHFQYLYVNFILIKLPQKVYRFNFEKWIGKLTGNGNLKCIKFGSDEETRPASYKVVTMPLINEHDEEEEED